MGGCLVLFFYFLQVLFQCFRSLVCFFLFFICDMYFCGMYVRQCGRLGLKVLFLMICFLVCFINFFSFFSGKQCRLFFLLNKVLNIFCFRLYSLRCVFWCLLFVIGRFLVMKILLEMWSILDMIFMMVFLFFRFLMLWMRIVRLNVLNGKGSFFVLSFMGIILCFSLVMDVIFLKKCQWVLFMVIILLVLLMR